jgi:molybdenum cofactor cytidylyltransferase
MWILRNLPSIWLDVKQPTVIILASGRGERFIASGGQGSKLQALIGSKTVLQHTLDAVKATGLPWHLEDAGHPGMGDSIAVAQAIRQGAQAAYPVYVGERGHPVGFAASAANELLSLKGNQGAAGVLSARNAIEIIVADMGCISDIDTVAQLQALQALQERMSKRA